MIPPGKLGLWRWGIQTVVRHGRPDVALAFWGGLGDELLCTAPIVEWHRRGVRKIWICTRKAEIFDHLAPGLKVFPDDRRYVGLAGGLRRPFRFLSYAQYDPTTDKESSPARHVIAEMCARAGLGGSIEVRPHWRVTEAERAAAAPWRDHIAIQTSTLTAHVPMSNKQWLAERFQAVVDRFAGREPFVQLGSENDPFIRGAVDLRGRTSIRETAAILHGARAFVGLVGFLMHLARAVDCPAVIVYGGRETPDLTGYNCNVNLTHLPACAPCWQRSRCDFRNVCMTEISAHVTVDALESLLARPRGPLVTDHAVL